MNFKHTEISTGIKPELREKLAHLLESTQSISQIITSWLEEDTHSISICSATERDPLLGEKLKDEDYSLLQIEIKANKQIVATCYQSKKELLTRHPQTKLISSFITGEDEHFGYELDESGLTKLDTKAEIKFCDKLCTEFSPNFDKLFQYSLSYLLDSFGEANFNLFPEEELSEWGIDSEYLQGKKLAQMHLNYVDSESLKGFGSTYFFLNN